MSGKWFRSSGVGKWPRWLRRSERHQDSSNAEASNPVELEQSLLKNLECPICLEYMTPPLHLCRSGHNICSNCRPDLTICPTCRQEILEARNYALEDLCLKLNYPCKFLEDGCKDMFSGSLIKEHQAVCHFGTHRCPLNKVPEVSCIWCGTFKDLVTHLESQHEDLVCTDAKFGSPETFSSSTIILMYNEIFLYYKCFRDGKCYCAVQVFAMGSQASKFKYKVKLRAENQIEKISQVFLVQSITKEFDDLFRTGKCARFDEEVTNQYIVNDSLELIVEVSHIKVDEVQEVSKCKMKRSGFHPVFIERPHWPWGKF